MAKLFIEDTSLVAIGDAIRAKTGTEDLLSPSGMVAAIEGIETGGVDIPEEAFHFTGDCSYMFAGNKWAWFINDYGPRITTSGITNVNFMFNNANKLESIPFDINYGGTSYTSAQSMFANCQALKEINGVIRDLYPDGLSYLFQNCYNLRYLPVFEDLNMSRTYSNNYANLSNMFNGCFSLRSIPEDFLKQLRIAEASTSSFYCAIYGGFNKCYVLDEIRGIYPQPSKMTSNMFSSTFSNCSRVKDVVFAVQDDGTPYTVTWSSQTIDLYGAGVHVNYMTDILNYNSGITADKEVKDDATYAALKNDADWFTGKWEYSRYNHDSAVNTINSLPDVSSGTGNSIKFKGDAGSKTDGGAINTMTEDEVAVAAAKGWTITLA